jgi:N-ethylmaleimide reductase
MTESQALLTPFKMGDLTLKNRVVMAPLTRSRANNEGNVPTDELQGLYYELRASAGLIISEGSQISKEAVGYINTPGIYSKAQIEGWKKVTKRVHNKGGKIFIQLWHVGRISHPYFHNGKLPLAPSAINPNTKSYTKNGFEKTVTPKEMSLGDIERTVKDFAQAAKNAMEAGFDGVEIHASNGYLFHQFFCNSSNIRSDNYGGTIENKTRILFEVIDEMKKVIPENRIGVRLNPSMHEMGGIEIDEETLPTFDYIVKKLNNYKLAYLHLSEPFNDVSEVPFAEPNIAKRYRSMYKGTLMINTGFTRETGNAIVEENGADLVAFGKPFISNPDLVERFQLKEKLNEWDATTFATPGIKGYLDYPLLNP